jgi:hypothetical protein
MKDKSNQKIRRWIIISAISLFIMTLAAGYAYGYVFGQIYQPENLAATLDNIESNYTLYTRGILAWGIIFVTDLLVTYGFYVYLRPAHKNMALISGLFRLVYTLVLGVAILFLINKDIHTFDRIWSLGLIIFGFHLTITGMILIKEKGLLKILSILLIIAGLSYSLVHGFYNFLPDFNAFTSTLETILVLPMTMGELFFAIYLLIKGGKRT